jgi:methyl-accepting chemotaxis protein
MMVQHDRKKLTKTPEPRNGDTCTELSSILQRWSLNKKLLGLGILGALPILILGWLLIDFRNEQIQFTSKELRGTVYQEYVWNVLAQRVLEPRHGNQPANHTKKPDFKVDSDAVARLESATIVHDEEMLPRDSSKSVLDALKNPQGNLEASKKLAFHIEKIGYGSNLMLDPEPNSLALILVQTIELPRLLSEVQMIEVQLAKYGRGQTPELETRIEVLSDISSLEQHAENIEKNYIFAFGTGDMDAVKNPMQAKLAVLKSQISELKQSLRTHLGTVAAASASSDKFDQMAESALLVGNVTDSIWRENNKILISFLKQRETRLWNNLIITASTILCLLTLSLLAAFLVARSIRLPIRNLVETMGNLREGKLVDRVPYLNDNNEAGDIARALEASRRTQIELAGVRSEADSKLGEEKERATEMSVFLENVSAVVRSAANGEFDNRLMPTGQSEFLRELSKNLNNLLDIVGNGINETSRIVKSLSKGEVHERMQGDYRGLFSTLMYDVNHLSEKLQAIASQISNSSQMVHGATHEISAGVTDLSSRTEQQASSLEETAASMEELAATVRQNAENAQSASRLATDAQMLAENGGSVAIRASVAMERIERSSQRVSDIVGLIQEIAFQTNILALNAAVEAARAGEAGRGFAVVANEVRALAQRSALASKDIKELIFSTGESVNEGASLVKQVGTSLNEIVAAVQKTANIVSEIAGASQEQSRGIDQVSSAVADMEEMTQKNASLVEETNAALFSAQAQIGELRSAVSFFRTSHQTEESTVPKQRTKEGFEEILVRRKSDRKSLKQPNATRAAQDPANIDTLPEGLNTRLRELAQKMARLSDAKDTARRSPNATVPVFPRLSSADWKEF